MDPRPDLFLSYATEDRERAKTVAEALEAEGWSVWWDRSIDAGDSLGEATRNALDGAVCVVVLWSKASNDSVRVKDEASAGKARDALVPASLDGSDPPLGFRRIQTAPLAGWDGDHDHPGFVQLRDSVARRLAAGPAHPSASEVPPRQARPREESAGTPEKGADRPAAGDTLFGVDVSPSVYQAVADLTEPVTASAIAANLFAIHPEYLRGKARSIKVDPERGESALVSTWFERVRSVLRSPSATLHGRLLIAALARIDEELMSQLTVDGFISVLQSEIREPLDILFVDVPESEATPAPDAAVTPSVTRVMSDAAALLSSVPDAVPGTDRAAVLLCALLYATDGAPPTVAAQLLAAVPGDADARRVRIESARAALQPSAKSTGATTGAQAVAEQAQRLRERTGDEAVHQRHLLAAALSLAEPTIPIAVLAALGVSLPTLRTELRRAIRLYVPGPASADWDKILADAQDAFVLAGGVSSDAVDPTHGIPQADDKLGVSIYVSMLASIIADRRTPEPLSIGLFGEWGSGKSTFMGLLWKQVELRGKLGEPYYAKIKQIPFNAWHYADANIWASLGDEIFEQLAGPEPSAEAQRTELQEKISKVRQRQDELTVASTEAEAKRLSLELDVARAKRRSSASDLAKAALGTGKLKGVWANLGISDTVEQGRLLGDEVRGTVAEVDALRLVTAGHRGVILLGLAALVMVLASAAILLPEDTVRIAQAAIAALTTLLTAAVWFVGRVHKGLSDLHQTAGEMAQELDKGDSDLKRKVDALRNAEADQRVLQAQRDQVIEKGAELGSQLAELSPGQRLYRFVTERAAGDEYRRHLSLISTVRKDFERLVELLTDGRTTDGTTPDGADRIDRIVLYIDDLDRCSPQQVVQVLQAVHLLLALKLFVVVVGVDPRWLLRSLQSEYDRLLTTDSAMSTDVWQASPYDYLEKIFNIPFALPRMNHMGFGSLLKSFAGEDTPGSDDAVPSSPPESETLDPETSGGPETPRPADGGAEAQPVPGPLAIEPHSEVADVATGAEQIKLRPLSEPELLLLGSLTPLVQTPREAKRLVNLYRLVRSTKDLRPASQFLGEEGRPGEYEAVVILLGLVSGHGRLLQQVLAGSPDGSVLGGLVHRPTATTWRDFAAGLQPKGKKGSWTNHVVGAIADGDAPSWRQLHDGLTAATALVTLPDLAAFQFWAPEIARFSFLLSPFAPGDGTPASRAGLDPSPGSIRSGDKPRPV